MALDNRRNRASAAGIALAFLGTAIVPDGSIAVGDRQAIGNSYYAIDSSVVGVTIGGTSQLEAFDSSGGITLERVIGGTSQLEAFDSSGGITLERVIGGTSQLNPFTSSGGIQVGESEAEAEANTGGFLYVRYEQERYRREEERRLQKEAKQKAKLIKDKLDRELALAERAIEEETARTSELERITQLVENNQEEILAKENPVLTKAMTEAIEAQTFSRMERLERLLERQIEEEEFLFLATQILVNQ